MKKSIFQKIKSGFYKNLYKYTHSKRYRHNRRLWPHIKVLRDDSGQITKITHKGHDIPIVHLTSLKNYYADEELMLIASGPSINEIDFSHSQSIKTMGVNGAYSLKSKVHFHLYVIGDLNFFSDRKDIVKDLISSNNILLFIKVDGLNKIIDLFGYESVLCKIALFEDFCSPIYQAQIPFFEIKSDRKRNKSIYFSDNVFINNNNIAFEKNIINGVFPCETIVYSALQIVVYLGFKTIYLAGVDMNNFNLPRFYEKDGDIVRSHLELEFKDNIYPAFKHASDVMKKLNVKVINMSLDSGLDNTIFEKKSYDLIFKIKNT